MAHAAWVSVLVACGPADRASFAPAPSPSTARPVVVSIATSPAARPAVSSAASPTPAPARRVLAKGPRFDNPTRMVVDDTTVYFTSAGRVLAVAKDGSGDPQAMFTGITIAAGLTLDEEHLYVAAQLTDLAGPDKGGIVRVNKRTLETKVLAQHQMPGPIAMDDATIWFGAADERVWRIPKTGGKPVAIAGVRGTVQAIDFDATQVYFAATKYIGSQRGTLYTAPRKGGNATVLLEGLSDAMGVAVVGDDLFFNDNGAIHVRSLRTGETRRISGAGSATDLVRSPRAVFWSAVDVGGAAASSVATFDLETRTTKILATEPAPVGVTADAHHVYWADAASRELVSLVR